MCASGDAKIVKVLAQQFTDKNSDDANSLVVTASQWGSLTSLKALLEAGFNPNATYRGSSAITATVNDGAVKMLLDSGADPNLEDPTGKTPMMNARIRSLDAIVDLLRNAGAKDDI